ncbi:MAG: site-specific integrase [Myxococcales bacterium]|nr:site-specific integrase [Myxococcales bacterium]
MMRLVGGGWQGRFWYTNQTGDRIRFRLQISSTGTRREAETKAAELKRQADRLGYVPGFNDPPPPPEVEVRYTFSGFSERFYKLYALVENGRSEQRNKESHIRNHLLPFFGDMDIRDIDAEKVAEFKAVMQKKLKALPPKTKTMKKRQENEVVSPSTINRSLGTLRKMMNVACDWRYISSVPKIRDLRLDPVEQDCFTIEERDLFLETCLKYRPEWHCFFAVLAHTGLRRGEAAALRWEDIQFADRTIRVRRSRDRDGTEGPPKTREFRTVEMNSFVYELLKAHQHLKGPYVFYNSAGGKLDINGGAKVLKWVCRMAGLRAIRIHDFRHTFVTTALDKTGDVFAVMKIAGHKHLSTTQRYGHENKAARRRTVESIVTKKSEGATVATPDSETPACAQLATEVATEPLKLKIVGSEQ